MASRREKFDTLRETAIGWFYGALRNAIIDHRRRKTVTDKRRENYPGEASIEERDDELHGVACQCVAELVATLKPE